jgi:hypothetical protein
VLYPTELRGHVKYQLLTIILSSFLIKLCQLVPKRLGTISFPAHDAIITRLLVAKYERLAFLRAELIRVSIVGVTFKTLCSDGFNSRSVFCKRLVHPFF